MSGERVSAGNVSVRLPDRHKTAQRFRVRVVPDGVVSDSCLCYLFADRFIRRLRWNKRETNLAVEVPMSGALVKLAILERQLLAVAVWSLYDRGAITLRTDGTDQRPGTSVIKVKYRIALRTNGFPDQLPAGIEGRLLAHLGPEPTSVREVVAVRWLDNDFLPLNGVVVLAQREAVDAGLLNVVRSRAQPKPLRWTQGHTTVTANSHQVRHLEPAAAAMARRLEAFKRLDEATWNRLVIECGRVLAYTRPLFLSDAGGG
jgi:hypothetical protein